MSQFSSNFFSRAFFPVHVSSPVNHCLSCVFLHCPCIEPCQSLLFLCISSLSMYRALSIIACLVYFFTVHVSNPVNHRLSCVFLPCPCIEPCQSSLVLCISSLSVYRTLSIIACLVYFFPVHVSNPVNHRLSCVFLPCPCIEPCQSSLVLCISSLSVYRTLSIIACLVYFPLPLKLIIRLHRSRDTSLLFSTLPAIYMCYLRIQVSCSANVDPRYESANIIHKSCPCRLISESPVELSSSWYLRHTVICLLISVPPLSISRNPSPLF